MLSSARAPLAPVGNNNLKTPVRSPHPVKKPEAQAEGLSWEGHPMGEGQIAGINGQASTDALLSQCRRSSQKIDEQWAWLDRA